MSKEVDEQVLIDIASDCNGDLHVCTYRHHKEKLEAKGYTIKKKPPEPEPGQVWFINGSPRYLCNNNDQLLSIGLASNSVVLDIKGNTERWIASGQYKFGYHSLEEYFREKFEGGG